MDIFLFFAVALLIALPLVWLMHDRQRVPLHDLGVESVQRVLSFENAEYRSMVWRRGWLTRKEWRELNEKQLSQVTAELKRRGFE